MPEEKLTPEVVEANLGILDYAIFDHLPDEGTVLGYHPLYKSARQLLHELNEALPDGAPLLKMPELNTRLRSLHAGGLVLPVAAKNLTGKTDGWQRRRRAANLLADYKYKQEPQAPEAILEEEEVVAVPTIEWLWSPGDPLPENVAREEREEKS